MENADARAMVLKVWSMTSSISVICKSGRNANSRSYLGLTELVLWKWSPDTCFDKP